MAGLSEKKGTNKNQCEEKIFFWIIQASVDNHHFSNPAVRGARNFPGPGTSQPRKPASMTWDGFEGQNLQEGLEKVKTAEEFSVFWSASTLSDQLTIFFRPDP